jgi:hypothetical protein
MSGFPGFPKSIGMKVIGSRKSFFAETHLDRKRDTQQFSRTPENQVFPLFWSFISSQILFAKCDNDCSVGLLLLVSTEVRLLMEPRRRESE